MLDREKEKLVFDVRTWLNEHGAVAARNVPMGGSDGGPVGPVDVDVVLDAFMADRPDADRTIVQKLLEERKGNRPGIMVFQDTSPLWKG